jgi:hypothetical protein
MVFPVTEAGSGRKFASSSNRLRIRMDREEGRSSERPANGSYVLLSEGAKFDGRIAC